jgi:hypothetical protein
VNRARLRHETKYESTCSRVAWSKRDRGRNQGCGTSPEGDSSWCQSFTPRTAWQWGTGRRRWPQLAGCGKLDLDAETDRMAQHEHACCSSPPWSNRACGVWVRFAASNRHSSGYRGRLTRSELRTSDALTARSTSRKICRAPSRRAADLSPEQGDLGLPCGPRGGGAGMVTCFGADRASPRRDHDLDEFQSGAGHARGRHGTRAGLLPPAAADGVAALRVLLPSAY